jgi:RHS repeat-associated protein
LDSQGNVVNRISYDAFGGVTAETNPSVDFRFLYTGQEYDPETGNYFYNTRFYNPLNGVFIQEDKIGFAGGDTNLYRYVGNSPTNYIDPSGNIPFPLVVIASVIIADLLIPDGVQAPLAPTDSHNSILSPEDLDNLSPCDDAPHFDNVPNLDRSFERGILETFLSGGLNNLVKTPALLKEVVNSVDDLAKVAKEGLDNLLPRDLGSIPVPVTGTLDDAARQADDLAGEIFGNGLDGLRNAAPGLGAAADDLFKPYFDIAEDATNQNNPWKFNPNVDVEFRNTGKNVKDALDEAFNRTGVLKEEFTPTKWGRDANGKSFPTEYKVLSGANQGAEVNVDVGHIKSNKGPLVSHVGYQTPGKRNSGGAIRGHILIDNVPYNR